MSNPPPRRSAQAGLRFVVVDEAHAYRGAFGSHTALVLRRLRRLCSYLYGAHPQFFFASATVINPVEHVRELSGLPSADIALVDEDGSPSAAKMFVLWNPALKVRVPTWGVVVRRVNVLLRQNPMPLNLSAGENRLAVAPR